MAARGLYINASGTKIVERLDAVRQMIEPNKESRNGMFWMQGTTNMLQIYASGQAAEMNAPPSLCKWYKNNGFDQRVSHLCLERTPLALPKSETVSHLLSNKAP